MDFQDYIEEVGKLSTNTSRGVFPQKYVCEGICVFCLMWNVPRYALTQKKAGFPCSGLNAGTSFISQDEGMSQSSVDTLEKALSLTLFGTGGLTIL